MCVVVWICEIFVWQEVSHFLSIFGFVFGQGSILGLGVDKVGSLSHKASEQSKDEHQNTVHNCCSH